MLKLVLEVSENNFNQKDKKYIQDILNEAENKFLNLMEKDIKVYKENSKNEFANKENLKKLIEVPLEIYITSTEIINLKNKFKNKVKNTVKADYEIALDNLRTAKRGAKTIIESNYNFFDDHSQYIKNIRSKLESYN